jgi:hypothetical protein
MAGRGRGRGRRGGQSAFIASIATELGTTPVKLRKSNNQSYEPQPTFPKFILPRPSLLSQEETNMVKYYKSLRNKIKEETPFYITVRKRPAENEEDDGSIPNIFGEGADF